MLLQYPQVVLCVLPLRAEGMILVVMRYDAAQDCLLVLFLYITVLIFQHDLIQRLPVTL